MRSGRNRRALRAAGGGPTLIVSPLLALMRDQVGAAAKAGLRAATVNSTNVQDWDAVFAEIEAGRLDVLLVSPERLGNPGFARRLPGLVAAAGLVDVVHDPLPGATAIVVGRRPQHGETRRSGPPPTGS